MIAAFLRFRHENLAFKLGILNKAKMALFKHRIVDQQTPHVCKYCQQQSSECFNDHAAVPTKTRCRLPVNYTSIHSDPLSTTFPDFAQRTSKGWGFYRSYLLQQGSTFGRLTMWGTSLVDRNTWVEMVSGPIAPTPPSPYPYPETRWINVLYCIR